MTEIIPRHCYIKDHMQNSIWTKYWQKIREKVGFMQEIFRKY